MADRRRTTGGSALELLWAPWRHAFVAGQKPRRCIFCTAKTNRNHDERYLVIARGRRAFCLLNRYPYSNGHVMLAPYRHIGRLEAVQPEEWTELFNLSQGITRRLQRLLHDVPPELELAPAAHPRLDQPRRQSAALLGRHAHDERPQ